ncbi:hypothetical protein IV02_29235 [Pseudomonas syringae]|uniref:Uncharacterized protein n=1 Tax=Pseudomonas syringae TaxID=317 RepID=A0A085UMW1_PSESX|nr:hypothetical protein IV02_29235 [Pseudomonas syringae]
MLLAGSFESIFVSLDEIRIDSAPLITVLSSLASSSATTELTPACLLRKASENLLSAFAVTAVGADGA